MRIFLKVVIFILSLLLLFLCLVFLIASVREASRILPAAVFGGISFAGFYAFYRMVRADREKNPSYIRQQVLKKAEKYAGKVPVRVFLNKSEEYQRVLMNLQQEGICHQEDETYIFPDYLLKVTKVCPFCGSEFPVKDPIRKCPNCGGTLEVKRG